MRLSLRWLGELVDLEGLGPEEVAEALTFHTAEVERLERPADGLCGVVAARVVAVDPHPGADSLAVCRLDVGAAEPVRVVCGAPGVVPGLLAPWVPPGVTLPGGQAVHAREVRGVPSAGLLASAAELDLGEDAAGLLALPAAAVPGQGVGAALGLDEVVLEVANAGLTHRPDLWGHEGFARELSALLRRDRKPPALLDLEPGGPAAGAVPVSVEDPQGCRRYLGLVCEGVSNRPAPTALRWRLRVLGLRSLGLVVDLTNFVLLELGQPLHAFDLDRLEGPAVRVRSAGAGEAFTTLDGVARTLDAADLVIADARRPLALAGVMGGAESEVGETTRRILLESATFDPVRVRRSARRHGLRTEASSRYEKALDPELAPRAAARYAHLLLAHDPAVRCLAPVADAYPGPYPPVTIRFDPALVRRRTGLRVPEPRTRAVLQALGFGLAERGRHIEVTVPSWRATKDVRLPEDLVEEVGRIVGYGDILPMPPVGALVPQRTRPERTALRALAVAALERGYHEIKSYSFYGPREAEALGLGAAGHLAVRNPLTEDQDRLILSTAADLLRAAARNQARTASARLWEHARLFVPRPGGPPAEVEVVAAGVYDRERAADAAGALFLSLVADLRVWLARLGLGGACVRQGTGEALAEGLPAPAWLHPGRQAVFEVDGRRLAVVGEVAPRVARAFGVEGRAATAELDLGALLAARRPDASEYRPLLRYPVVPFDVSVIVPRRTPAEAVRAALRAAAPDQVRDVEVFDVYEGAGIPEGRRSLALSCALYDAERTLGPAEADALRQRMLAALEAQGWVVRRA